ncbi:MAG: hypothetical protein L0228_10015 [Planctomycetes bacterium]|nr:hypothetical protein [Planctomycetota bacterium]
MSATVSEPMEDGTLHFKVRAQDGSEREHSVDVLLLKIACEECVLKHKLATDQKTGAYVPTVEFYQDLAARLAGGLGVEGCTPSIAHQLWHASAVGIEALKKNASETPSSDSGSESNPEGAAETAS